MKEHKGVAAALAEACKERRCAYGTSPSLRRALNRRVAEGTLVSPLNNIYMPKETWHGLDSCERSRHIARALACLHPNWVFAGLTAACMHGFDHSWTAHDGAIRIADLYQSGRVSGQPIERVYMQEIPIDQVDGITVTDQARTVIDCGLFLPFEHALGIIDSALRQGLDTARVLEQCAHLRTNHEAVLHLIEHADARSENGGESLTRGTILTLGFARPELQVEFTDPSDPRQTYRVDFLWRLHDGRIIVLEFDGTRKYVDPQMTGARTVRQVVNDQIERDRILKEAGVTTVVHCFHNEVIARQPLYDKLRDAGVPWVGCPFN